MKTLVNKGLALLLCLCVCLIPSCGDTPPAGISEPLLTFSETNERGNTNGNAANMGLAVRQGEWIVFSDMADDAYLKATKDGGRHCVVLMEDLADTYACLNLIGDRLDYVSTTYGDVNTLYINEEVAMPTWSGQTYCLQSVKGDLWFVDESGDGRIYRVNPQTGEETAVGSHKAYVSGVTDAASYTTFSVDGEFVYYAAADDGNSLYRVNLANGEETRLTDTAVGMLIAEQGTVLYTLPKENGRLYCLTADGRVYPVTKEGVSTFNTDGTRLWYADKSTGRVMEGLVSGGVFETLCQGGNVQYLLYLGDVLMLNGESDDGKPVTRFVDLSTKETYTPR